LSSARWRIAPGLARAFEIVELDQGLAPLGDELALDLLQVALELRVRHVGVGAFLEVHRGNLHDWSPAF
jgi:hypothetical protein